MKTMWDELSSPKRIGLITGLVLLLVLVIGLTTWVAKDNYDVLFSGVDTADQASIVAELEKLKIPYKISKDGASILVEKDSVHRTRLKVMSHGVDLKGTVGFEIFNEADFGASEFAQKINYQRALQGELARTITSVDEIKGARVHLVLPESGLLRRKGATVPKASVALTMKNGVQLSTDQIAGIQRLVAAAVPDLEAKSVVVSDQQGVTLSKASNAGADADGVSGQLEMKREAELYLTRKLADLLDKALGPGQAIVSVDVTLNHDQINSSREDILSAVGHDGQPVGVLVRKRQNMSGASGDAIKEDSTRPLNRGSGNESMEVEYAHGKKVEQVIGSPGSIKRLSVGVFLPPNLDELKVEKIREIVAMAVGFNQQRGDGIAIQSISNGTPIDKSTQGALAVLPVDPPTVRDSEKPQDPDQVIATSISYALIVIALLALLTWGLLYRRRLSSEQRERMLKELKTWLEQDKKAAVVNTVKV